jgi:hypothetical protein
MRVEIDCINKDPREDPYRAIKFVGGPNEDGTRWKLPLDAAVQGAQRGEWDFYVRQGGHIVEVEVAKSRFGNFYLKTEADGDTPDNLLSLRECQ